jgi:NDP-sugar pyrophosphorylase family protein
MSTDKIQLVIPMAGRGQRFSKAGYTELKPLINIHGVPMISIVLANLYSDLIDDVILIAQRETMETGLLQKLVKTYPVPVHVISVDEVTDGPADSVRRARPLISDQAPLVIANSDQYLDCDLSEFYSNLLQTNCSGSILTMQDSDPKWSYVKIDSDRTVLEVREKQVISSNATVGIYGFKSASFAWKLFDRMWANDDRTNQEFYVAPSYNYLLPDESPITVFDLGPVGSVMHGLGIPEDLEAFLESPRSWSAVEKVESVFIH